MELKMFRNWIFLFFCFFCLVAAGAEPSLRKMVPVECNFLLEIDMKAVVEHPVFKGFLMTTKDKNLQIMRELELSPEGVEYVVIGSNSEDFFKGGFESAEEKVDFVAVCRLKKEGGIKLDKVYEAAKLKNPELISKEDFEGYPAVVLKEKGQDIIFIEKGGELLLAGSREMVKKSLALKDAALKNFEENKELVNLVDKQKGLFKFVGQIPTFKKPSGDQPLDNPLASFFGEVNYFVLGITLDEKGVLLDTSLICKSDEAANNLSITMQFLTGMLAANEKSPVKAEQIKISNVEKVINVQISLDPASLGKVMIEAHKLKDK